MSTWHTINQSQQRMWNSRLVLMAMAPCFAVRYHPKYLGWETRMKYFPSWFSPVTWKTFKTSWTSASVRPYGSTARTRFEWHWKSKSSPLSSLLTLVVSFHLVSTITYFLHSTLTIRITSTRYQIISLEVSFRLSPSPKQIMAPSTHLIDAIIFQAVRHDGDQRSEIW